MTHNEASPVMKDQHEANSQQLADEGIFHVHPAITARKQSGIAMLEVMIASILILIAVAGAFVLFQMTSTTNQIADAREELGSIRGNVSRLFSQQSSFEGINNEIAAKAGLVPARMVIDADAGTIVNTFGGDVTIVPDDGAGAGMSARGANSHYSITYEQVPQEACIQLANYNRTDWEQGVSVNGTLIPQDSIATATAQCSDPDENELIFVGR